MTQAFNLSQLANYVNSSGKLSNSGLEQPNIPSGTLMLFVQTSAPTGWTKSTTHNNKALRVVSGTAGTGGSVGFTTALGTPAVSGSIEATTLSTAQIPSHSHSITTRYSGAESGSGYVQGVQSSYQIGSASTNSQGGGSSHTHSMSGVTTTINVAYVDVIIATKD